MKLDEIQPLTPDRVADLVQARCGGNVKAATSCKRRKTRWPCRGNVELWLPRPGGPAEHVIGYLRELSEAGAGIRTKNEIEPGQVLSIAIHQPEASLYGKAIVRHCTHRPDGCHVGVEFEYD